MRLGCDYYPEHWPESRWEEDARLMQEAGLTLTRLAEFAWSRLEPREGEFRFDWLERAVETLSERGIESVLGTPTAAPPAWLVKKYPDVIPVDARGVKLGFGTRLHRCYSSESYRARSRAITEAMAGRFGENAHVIGWQTDNEFARVDCTCPNCAAKWREWLKGRYGSPEELNRAWGTVFWSQEYGEWDEVPPLAETKCGVRGHNPSLILDWRRFQSENAVSFQREQVEILKSKSPGKFITHNFMGLHTSLDYYALAEDLDLAAWDNYPRSGLAGVAHNVTRGLKGKSFWVMEERCGHTGWFKFSSSPQPGQIRLWTWEAVGRGADAVVYFRWRSCTSGTEQYWQGILNHDGTPRRRYREIARTAGEVKTLSKVLEGSVVENRVAVFNDYENIWALDIQPQTEGFSFRSVQLAYTSALDRLGAGYDVIGPGADFSKYRVVIFPPLYLVADDLAEKIESFVKAGGVTVLSARSGVKDVTNLNHTSPLPGKLARLAGLEISDYDALGRGQVDVELSDGARFKASVWCDVLDLRGAEELAIYRSNYYLGEPAMAVNSLGEGRCYYIGAVPEKGFYAHFLRKLLDELGDEPADEFGDDPAIARVAGLPEGVAVSKRTREGKPILFVLNGTGEAKEVPLPDGRRNLLTREKEDGVLQLEAYGVRVYAV